ncbi:MAG TPA: hypothetical protein VK194_06365, partial [Candidatus Deferrimicrobium sp.]|nr:hypothetical protein [Candidatus Deferrimicrobium sp.]
MLDRSVTRVVFDGLGPTGEAVFYILAAIATAVFLIGLGLKLQKYSRGRGEDRFGSLSGFLGRASVGIVATATSRTVAKRDVYAGVFHAAIMWGFIVLFIGTVILTIDTDIVGIFAPDYHFFWGPFYLVYSLVLDLLGLALVVGLGAMAWRRLRFRKPELDYRRVDIAPATSDRTGFAVGDWVFLGWLLILGVTGFVVEGVRIVASSYPWFEVFSPVGMLLARIFGTLGLSAAGAADLHLGLWWFHAIIALGFVAYIPYAKAIHIVADGVNVALRSPLAGKRLPVLPAVVPPPPALTR